MSLGRLLIAGGGTGGHVFPAIAVGEAFLAEVPRGQLLFVGAAGGLEAELVPARGHRLEELAVGKLAGVGLSRRLATYAGLPRALLDAVALIRDFRPQVVVGVGGYASGPLTLAAALLSIPVVLLEQNAVLGRTNRLLSPFAKHVVVAFGAAKDALPRKALFLGNPLRAELIAASEVAPKKRKNGAPTLLVMGGSQGASRINELCCEIAAQLFAEVDGLTVIHQTGARDYQRVRDHYEALEVAAEVFPFTEDLADVYQRADLVCCRAGATTLAELYLFGLPAFLVPYPFAANDHQAVNGRDAVEAGGAVMQRQDTLDGAAFSRQLIGLLSDGARLEVMASGMRSLGRPRAAHDVVSLLCQLAAG